MAIIKIKGYVFSDASDSLPLLEELRGYRRKGMSGCVYGPVFGPVSEAYHITSGGKKEVYLPQLIDIDNKTSDVCIPGSSLKVITKPDIAAAMLLQVHKVHAKHSYEYEQGHSEVEKLLDTPLAVGYFLYKVYVNPIHCHKIVEEIYYNRPAWPERPFIEWKDFTIPVPRVGINNVIVTRLIYPSPWYLVMVGDTKYCFAQLEGRGRVYYTVEKDFIVGAESLFGNVLRFKIKIPSGQVEFVELMECMIGHRLGDILVLPESVAERWNLSEVDSLQKVAVSQNKSEIMLSHMEYGLLKVRKKEGERYKFYKVPIY